MGKQDSTSGIKIGIAYHSPLDFDSHVDKSLKRTINPDWEEADILYTKKIVDTKIKIQVIFSDFDFLQSWDLLIGDVKAGKRIKLTNELTDNLIKGQV